MGKERKVPRMEKAKMGKARAKTTRATTRSNGAAGLEAAGETAGTQMPAESAGSVATGSGNAHRQQRARKVPSIAKERRVTRPLEQGQGCAASVAGSATTPPTSLPAFVYRGSAASVNMVAEALEARAWVCARAQRKSG